MKRKKLLIDEKKNIDKIWRLARELKKTIEKVERDVAFKRKKSRSRKTKLTLKNP